MPFIENQIFIQKWEPNLKYVMFQNILMTIFTCRKKADCSVNQLSHAMFRRFPSCTRLETILDVISINKFVKL